MRAVIKDIMKLFKDVDEETAEIIVTEMKVYGLDFSECTQRKFNKAAREAADRVFADCHIG